MTDGQSRRDQIIRDRRSRPLWSNCILCIPFILSGISNECWLHTCDVCVMITWRLGLRATRGARNKCSVISERVVAIFSLMAIDSIRVFPSLSLPLSIVADPRGGAWGARAPLIWSPNCGLKGRKKFFPLYHHYSGYLLTHILELNFFLFKGHCAGCHCTTVENWTRMKC